jgi:hypothetical protein
MLLAAAVCGILAFVMNLAYLSIKSTPQEYVRVKQAVEAGTLLTKDLVEVVELYGDVKSTAVPFGDVATLYQLPAPRDFQAGELVLWQDVKPKPPAMQLRAGETALHVSIESLRVEPSLLHIGDQIGFVVPKYPAEAGDAEKLPPDARREYQQIGPFRILSIDEKVVESPVKGRSLFRIGTLSVATRLESDGRSFSPDANNLIQAFSREEIGGITLNGQVLGAKVAAAGE